MDLMPEVQAVPTDELKEYIRERAETIVSQTQGDSWDDPEEWQIEAVELAHAVMRLLDQ